MSYRRPSDFPHDMVNVAKIRAKLERGGLLSMGLNDNHRDSIALSSAVSTSDEPQAANHSNSLDTRAKLRYTNPCEWHSRRKSYGFERMSSPEKTNLKNETSTDSGLGRSADLLNWYAASGNRPLNENLPDLNLSTTLTKHPIVENFYEEIDNSIHGDEVDGRNFARQSSLNDSKYYQKSETNATSVFLQKGPALKRVEFSKTEVHFATGTGRVNIIETDSKPPSTNNFRRKKTVTTTQRLVKSAKATSEYVPSSIASVEHSLRKESNSLGQSLIAGPLLRNAAAICDTKPPNVTVTVPIAAKRNLSYLQNKRDSYASVYGVDTIDYEAAENASLKGILKINPVLSEPIVSRANKDRSDDLRHSRSMKGKCKHIPISYSKIPIFLA